MTRIVVGIDGSTHAEAALDWALQTAAVSHHDITAVSAWEPSGGSPLPLDLGMRTHLDEGLAEASLAMTENAIAAARDRCPGSKRVAISALAVEGDPGSVLVHAASSAQLLVVGRHGRGAFGLERLGSVAAHCLHHAHGPVVVVPPGTGLLGSELPFVVAVDGSKPAANAARWTAGLALSCGRRLVLVHTTESNPDAPPSSLEALRRRMSGWAVEVLSPFADLTYQVEVVAGASVPILVRRADTAALMVLGVHHRNALTRLLVGSVSSTVARSASCPVAIVPDCLPVGRKVVDAEGDSRADADAWSEHLARDYARAQGRLP